MLRSVIMRSASHRAMRGFLSGVPQTQSRLVGMVPGLNMPGPDMYHQSEEAIPTLRPRLVLAHDLVGDVRMPGQIRGECGVKNVAIRSIQKGEVVLRETGVITASPTMHSFQIGINQHINVNGEMRFVSHSCDPNCKIVVYKESTHPMDLVAIKDIPKGAELSWDYNTNEWEMESPFEDCSTGQMCAGFKHLPAEERVNRLKAGLITPHIMELWLLEIIAATKQVS